MAEERVKVAPGAFIALEGVDGSGKATQLRLLAARLKAVGYDVAVFEFPRYSQASSYFVRQYLSGAYGPASKVNPYTASLFYALDRFEAAPDIRRALNSGKVVLTDRYVGSNMGHQGSKLINSEQQRGFFVWEDSLEFNLLGIPRPDINIFLRLPSELSLALMTQRASQGKSQKKLDEHEADAGHLRQAAATYDQICRLFPKDFVAIDCSQNNKVLPIPLISDKVWEAIRPLLPKNKPHQAKGLTLQINAASGSKTNKPETQAENQLMTSASHLKFELKQVSSLAVNYLYGVDGLNVHYENSWNGPSPAYGYYALRGLSKDLAQKYKQTMSRLIELHKQLGTESKRYLNTMGKAEVNLLAKKMANVMLATTPLAAMNHLKIEMPASSLSELITRLQAGQTDETTWLIKQLQTKAGYRTGHQSSPVKAASIAQPEAINQTISRLSKTRLNMHAGDTAEPIKLLSYWPRNEFEVLAEGIYPYANLSYGEISVQLDTWKYAQKQAILQSLIRRSDKQILKQPRYRWDLVYERLTLNELIATGQTKDFRAQTATPRFGYHLPPIIEDIKAEDIYLEMFDLSLGLFSDFQAAGREDLAPYVTLYGHKQRCQFTTSALNLLKLQKLTGISRELTSLIAEMLTCVREVHPTLLGETDELQKSAAGERQDQLKRRPAAKKRNRA